MDIRSDYWLDLGPLGEQPIEIKADVTEGDRDGPSIFRGPQIDIWQVVLVLNNQRIDITDQCLNNTQTKEVLVDQISDVYHDAMNEALAYRAQAYRHVDCHA